MGVGIEVRPIVASVAKREIITAVGNKNTLTLLIITSNEYYP